ncbi:MAG: glycosyltransferase family 2 protein [Gammaproteobacteria bacterium]|nr:glycosyltransferase family 2 protein [Gammaproteobacteria bacterium]
MCTYNGERFLKEQLASFSAQTHANWQLFVYDDASTDNTHKIIQQYQSTITQKLSLRINASSKGFCKNFLSAICTTPNESGDFFALSDQDDIWQANKLSKAINHLKTIPSHIPALYCSRTQTIRDNGEPLGFSPLFKKNPSFKNALVQSIAGGNTMVFNQAAKILITKAGATIDVISHDWWIYLLLTGAGGQVFYDPYPEILYRQHDSNLVGANSSLRAKLIRFKLLWTDRFKQWTNRNIAALNTCRPLLEAKQIKILDTFSRARQSSLLNRLYTLHQLGIYRQTPLGHIALFAAIFLNKL